MVPRRSYDALVGLAGVLLCLGWLAMYSAPAWFRRPWAAVAWAGLALSLASALMYLGVPSGASILAAAVLSTASALFLGLEPWRDGPAEAPSKSETADAGYDACPPAKRIRRRTP